MKITELLDRRSILLNGAPASKKDALDQMIALMVKSGKIRDEEAYRQEVYRREEEGTTGIGEGIAIPHGKCDAVIKPGLAAMVIPNGVDFDSLDGQPVHLIFLIAAPNTKDNIHLDVLSKLSMLLMDEKFVENLKNAKTVDEFLEIVDHADQEKPDVDDQLAAQTENAPVQYKCRILAVTSCPTGIAHTYMAAEGLEKAAKAAGCFIKVETRGSGGAKNVLTDQEIKDADCIIVAADAKVPMDRFHGKKLIECQVTDGISKADQLVERAIKGDAPVYQAGTLSGNPVAVTAGIETLKILMDHPEIYQSLEEKAACLERAFQKKGLTVNRAGSLLTPFFTGGKKVENYGDALGCDREAFRAYFAWMLSQNIYVAPSPFEAMFVSNAHTEELIEQTCRAIEEWPAR